MRTAARSLPVLVAAFAVVDLPLLALLLTPQLMRSRVEAWPGASTAGIAVFVLLPFVVLWLAPAVAATVRPAPGWTPRTAQRAVGRLVRRRPRTWARLLGEYLLLLVASQLLGGLVAALLPHFRRDPATPDAWLFSYPPYALQAVLMWSVLCVAHAWYAARVAPPASTLAGAGRATLAGCASSESTPA